MCLCGVCVRARMCVCACVYMCVVFFVFLKLEDPTTYLYIGQKNEDREIP